MIKLKKIHENAKLPTRMSDQASGFDVYAIEDIIIPHHPKVTVVQTGLQLAFCPPNIEIQVRQRGSMALKGLMIANAPGTIDSDYRGPIMILICNCTNACIPIRSGERIAQLVPASKCSYNFEFTDEVESTKRGDGALGSTGK